MTRRIAFQPGKRLSPVPVYRQGRWSLAKRWTNTSGPTRDWLDARGEAGLTPPRSLDSAQITGLVARNPAVQQANGYGLGEDADPGWKAPSITVLEDEGHVEVCVAFEHFDAFEGPGDDPRNIRPAIAEALEVAGRLHYSEASTVAEANAAASHYLCLSDAAVESADGLNAAYRAAVVDAIAKETGQTPALIRQKYTITVRFRTDARDVGITAQNLR